MTTVNPCRLSIDRGRFPEAALEGSPAALRALALALSRGHSTVIPLDTPGASVVQELNDSPRLMVAVGLALTLTLSGSAFALNLVWSALTATAESAARVTGEEVRRHTRIVYLGRGDQFRHPDTFPLVIGCNWPGDA